MILIQKIFRETGIYYTVLYWQEMPFLWGMKLIVLFPPPRLFWSSQDSKSPNLFVEIAPSFVLLGRRKKTRGLIPRSGKKFLCSPKTVDGLLRGRQIPTSFISLLLYWLQTLQFCILNLIDADCCLSVFFDASKCYSVWGYDSEQLSNGKSLDNLLWSVTFMFNICFASV